MMQLTLGAIAALAAMPVAYGQTFTDCNPLQKTCPADAGLQAASFESDFTKGDSAAKGWTAAAGTTINYGPKGAEFTIAKEGQAPTFETDFHILFGTIEVKMQAAPGTGIVSSIVLESADLDEIDWEFLGGNYGEAETNYFGKGDTTTYDRAIYHPVSSPQTTMHTYRIDWSPDRTIFYIDGNQVRVLNYADAKGGSTYPQTPMKLKLGNWAGGGPGSPAGTVSWAGGATDFNAGPFTMYVESVKITNMYPAKEYVWGDNSGTWQSIKAVQGQGVVKAVDNDSNNNNGDDKKSTDNNSSTTKSEDASRTTDAPKKTTETPANNAASTDDKTKTESATHTTAGNHTQTGNGTHEATGKPGQPALLNGNSTNSVHTSTKVSDETSAAVTAAAKATGAGNKSNTSTPAAATTSGKTSGAAGQTVVTGLVLIFTMSMCLWML